MFWEMAAFQRSGGSGFCLVTGNGESESGETEKCMDVGDVAETEPKSMRMRTREETRNIQI